MAFSQLIIFVVALAAAYIVGYYSKIFLESKELYEDGGFGTVEGSMLALFAFFLGFTFSITANKVEGIRVSGTNEYNSYTTAISRFDLYDDEDKKVVRGLMKDYLQDRLHYFDLDSGSEHYQTERAKADASAESLWQKIISLSKDDRYTEASRLIIPAVNEVFDSVSTRDGDVLAKLPPTILWMLYVLSISSCFIVGFTVETKIWTNFISIIYIAVVAFTVNLIIDAGDPRSGKINTHRANENIEQLLNTL